ncbi:quinon protein alcohol dehydrogenase-like superfamily [Mycena filopes]|nr:quinon protein alcohol dehydrogenase-like superfamily [Mycena filopes]
MSTIVEQNLHAAGVEADALRSNTLVQLIVVRVGTLCRIAQPFAQLNPISATALSFVQGMVKAVELRLHTDAEIRALTTDVCRVLNFVESAELLPRLEYLTPLIGETLRCVVDCMRYASHRTAYSALDVDRVTDLRGKLQILQSRMSHALTLNIAQTMVQVETKTSSIRMEEHLLNPVAMPKTSATHHRNTCFPGTRSHLLERLVKWGASPEAPNVFWLFGPAGTGKSTIATTLADALEHFGCLGSFVFLNRDVDERSEPSALIRTIAYRLASYADSPMKTAIASAITTDPHIMDAGLMRQFRRLILEPAREISPPAPVVIIIDALDEGGHGRGAESQKDFLAVLAEGLPQLPNHIRVLITSRRDADIVKSLSGLACVCEYDIVGEPDVDEDLRTYITARMKHTQEKYAQCLPASWPGSHLINRLVTRAAGLFIWAVVATSYIDAHNPKGRIIQVLENTAEQRYVEQHLDFLYETAIKGLSWELPDSALGLQHVLTVILMARTPLSPQSIADISGSELVVVDKSVSDLHSVLRSDAHGLIRLLHPSVRDYLTNPARCAPDNRWCIDAEAGHSYLAIECLNLLARELKYNSMKLDAAADFGPGVYNRCYIWNSPDYDGPASTEYACTFWIDHVCSVQRPDLLPTLQEHITKFYSAHFLHWLEMLSLMKRSRDAIRDLGKLHAWCLAHKDIPKFNPKLCDLVYDSWRFVNTFAQTIEAHPLLVYHTALPFLPNNTAIREVLTTQYPFQIPRILVGGSSEWDSCLYSMMRHDATVCSLAMSPRHPIIASGAGDMSVRLWNWETGVETLPPFGSDGAEDHTGDITAVQFSPDGTSLFSGSIDSTICCWDLTTGKLKTTLVDPTAPTVVTFGFIHGTRVYSLAVLLDGDWLGAGRHDGTIAVWSLAASARTPDKDLVGHGGPAFSIQTSADENMLVSGSEDATVRLWDIAASQTLKVYRGHRQAVSTVAFSPDMSRIASGSWDHTVRVWATESGSGECCVLAGHSDAVLAVAFSPDGRYIASGGRDRKICLWSTSENELLQQFTSPSASIHSLLFCDSTRLVSGTQNGEVRVWKVSDPEIVRAPENEMQSLHTKGVTAVAISNSGSLFASASLDSTVIIWNAATRQPAFSPLKIHSAAINCIAFSADDNILASGSRDRTVRLLDTNTGNVVEPVLHFSCEILCIKFLQHSSKLTIGLADDTVVVWDTITHTQTLQLTSNARLRALAASTDPDMGKIACMYSRLDGTPGFMVWNSTTGELLAEKDFTVLSPDEVDSVYLEGAHIAFSADNSHILVRYHYAVDGHLETRAFDLASGLEAPTVGERARRLYAQNAEIYKGEKIVMPLPRDFQGTDIARCWEVSRDVIMIGMASGRVYAIEQDDGGM